MDFLILLYLLLPTASAFYSNGIPFNLPEFRYCGTCNISNFKINTPPKNQLDSVCQAYTTDLASGSWQYSTMKNFLLNIWEEEGGVDGSKKQTSRFWLFYAAARAKIIYESSFLEEYTLRIFVIPSLNLDEENCLHLVSEGIGFANNKNRAPINSYQLDSIALGEHFERIWTRGIESVWAYKYCNSTIHLKYLEKANTFLFNAARISKLMYQNATWNDYWHYSDHSTYYAVPSFSKQPSNLPTCTTQNYNNITFQQHSLPSNDLYQKSHITVNTNTQQSNPTPPPVPGPGQPNPPSVFPSTSTGIDLRFSQIITVSPWDDDCYVIINEVAPFNPNLANIEGFKEFIELKKVCPPNKTNKKALSRVKIVIMNLITKKIYTFINLHNQAFNDNNLLTIYGDDEYVQTAGSQEPHKFIPYADTQPHIIIMLHRNPSSTDPSAEEFENVGFHSSSKARHAISFDKEYKVGRTGPKVSISSTIKKTVIDALVYGKGVNVDISYVRNQISSHFSGCNFVLLEDRLNVVPPSKHTINQCEQGIQRPYQYQFFKHGLPTPNQENDCSSLVYLTRILESGEDNTVGLTENPSIDTQCPSDDALLQELWTEIAFEEDFIRRNLDHKYDSQINHILLFHKQSWLYLKDELKLDLSNEIDPAKLYPYKVVTDENIATSKKLTCELCNQRLNKCPKTIRGNQIDDKMKNEGWWATNSNTLFRGLRDHVKKPAHYQSILQKVRETRIVLQAKEDKPSHATTPEVSRLNGLTNIIRAAYTLGLANTTPYSFSKIIDLLRITGADIGYKMSSRWTASRLTTFIGDCMHQTVIDFLLFAKCPVSIILDGSSDRQNNHYVLVYFQTIEGTRSLTYFYKLIKLGKESSAKAYLEQLTNAFMDDGLLFVEYIKEYVTAMITDGAANMVKLQKDFEEWVDRRDSTGKLVPLFKIFCTNHKLNLITRNSLIPLDSEKKELSLDNPILYMAEFEKKLNEFYNFFKAASKRIGEFRDIQKEFNYPRVELTYLYTQRWISSEHRTLRNFLLSTRTLDSTFVAIDLNFDKSYDKKAREKAKALQADLRDKRFLLVLHFMEDYTSIFSTWSKSLQTKNGLLISQYQPMITLDEELVNLGSPGYGGEIMIGFLNGIECSDTPGVDGCSLETYIKSEKIFWKGIEYTTNKDLDIPDFKKLADELIKRTQDKLDYYLPRETIRMLKIFQPTNFPAGIESLEQLREATGISGELVYLYGELEIKKICDVLGFGLECNNIAIEWAALFKSILRSENWETYRKLTDSAHFWSNMLRMKKLSWTISTKTIVQRVLTLASGSVVCETGFSIFNVIKNQRRTSISDESLESFLRMSSNGPKKLEYFDARRIARQWDNKGGEKPDDNSILGRFSKKDEDEDACPDPEQDNYVESQDIVFPSPDLPPVYEIPFDLEFDEYNENPNGLDETDPYFGLIPDVPLLDEDEMEGDKPWIKEKKPKAFISVLF